MSSYYTVSLQYLCLFETELKFGHRAIKYSHPSYKMCDFLLEGFAEQAVHWRAGQGRHVTSTTQYYTVRLLQEGLKGVYC